MEQVRSRKAIQEEGAHAALAGKGEDACPYEEGTDARDEWENGFYQTTARSVLRSSEMHEAAHQVGMLYSRAIHAMNAPRVGAPA